MAFWVFVWVGIISVLVYMCFMFVCVCVCVCSSLCFVFCVLLCVLVSVLLFSPLNPPPRPAPSRCFSWRAHTRQEVVFKDLVAVIRRVRREIEGPIGGTYYDPHFYSGDGDDSFGGGGDEGSGGGGEGGGRGGGGWGGGRGGGGRSPIVRRSLLLRYIINPSDGGWVCFIYVRVSLRDRYIFL